jgi:hypothetical protein
MLINKVVEGEDEGDGEAQVVVDEQMEEVDRVDQVVVALGDLVVLVVVDDKYMEEVVALVVLVVQKDPVAVVAQKDPVVVDDKYMEVVVALVVLVVQKDPVAVVAQKDLVVVVDLVVEGACGDSFSWSSYLHKCGSWKEFDGVKCEGQDWFIN